MTIEYSDTKNSDVNVYQYTCHLVYIFVCVYVHEYLKYKISRIKLRSHHRWNCPGENWTGPNIVYKSQEVRKLKRSS